MASNRSNYALKNIFSSLIYKVLTIILSFVSRTVFIWGFGIEYLGINGLFTDILSLLSLADLGFGVAMVYSFYEPLANNDYDKLSGLVNFYKYIYRIIAIGVLIIGILFMPILPYVINLQHDVPFLYLYYLIALFNVVASYLYVYKTSILTADQKNYIIVRVSMLFNTCKIIIQVLSIIIFRNYVIYLVIGSLFIIVNNIYASKKADEEYPLLNSDSKISKEEKKSISSNIFSAFIIKLASVILNATDNIIISVIVGTVAVGYYSNYLMIQNNIMSFYVLLFTSITASLGNLVITENSEKRYNIFQCSQTVAFIATCIIVPCYVLLINSFIALWLGESFQLGMIIVYAIGTNIYFSGVLQPLWSYREATGLYKKTKWIMVLCAILNIVLSIIGGKICGIAGIIFASTLSRLLTYVWYEPKLLFDMYFKNNVKTYYFDIVKNFALVCILIVITSLISKRIIIDSIITWIIYAIILFISLSLFALLVYRNTEGGQTIMNFAKKMLKRKA